MQETALPVCGTCCNCMLPCSVRTLLEGVRCMDSFDRHQRGSHLIALSCSCTELALSMSAGPLDGLHDRLSYGVG